jgi:hypothetical protein
MRFRVRRACEALWLAGLGLFTLAGCQAQQVTGQFSPHFDRAIAHLYETHVLDNLARCDNDEFFVQMTFGSFGSDLTCSLTTTGQLTFFTPADVEGSNDVVVNLFEQGFSPTLSSSQTSRLGFVANPAQNQPAVLEMYRAELAKPPEEQFFAVTDELSTALHAYCRVRCGPSTWYIVPPEHKRDFCEFVHRVSFAPAAEPPGTPEPQAAAEAGQSH